MCLREVLHRILAAKLPCRNHGLHRVGDTDRAGEDGADLIPGMMSAKMAPAVSTSTIRPPIPEQLRARYSRRIPAPPDKRFVTHAFRHERYPTEILTTYPTVPTTGNPATTAECPRTAEQTKHGLSPRPNRPARHEDAKCETLQFVSARRHYLSAGAVRKTRIVCAAGVVLPAHPIELGDELRSRSVCASCTWARLFLTRPLELDNWPTGCRLIVSRSPRCRYLRVRQIDPRSAPSDEAIEDRRRDEPVDSPRNPALSS